MPLNVTGFILPIKQSLIIQINHNTIMCALVTKNGTSYTIDTVRETLLEHTEAIQTHIANQTHLLHIAQSLLDGHIQATKLPIICFSSLTVEGLRTPLYILQMLFLLGKIGGPVIGLHQGQALGLSSEKGSTITIDSKTPNLIDQMQNPFSIGLTRRIILCISLVTISIISTTSYAIYLKMGIADVKLEEKRLTNYINTLQPKVYEAKKLEAENSVLYDRITTLKDLTEEDEFPAYICMAISETIPENTWLTSITIGGKADTKKHFESITQDPKTYLNAPPPTKVPLTIVGKTTAPDEIGSFLEAISHELPQATLSIEHVQRDHSKPHRKKAALGQQDPYNFSITGSIDE